MRAATLFSGIGAPELACPHWSWLWHAEIEPFPAAVMAHHHPTSINLGDVTAPDFLERALDAGRPDVLVFGSPCQSFSIAGKRLGLADPRGNLALTALALARRLRPHWIVFENVPGLLSDDGGRSMSAFLGAVEESGYLGCWRVLDARYWGLAQRRERVFFVGSLGDWRGPAEVLFEPEGMLGYPAPRRQAGQDIAATLTRGAESSGRGGYAGRRREDDINLVATTLRARDGAKGVDSDCTDTLVVAHTLRGEGFDAGEDGTGRGTPLVVAYGGNNTAGPIDVATARNAHGGPHGRLDFESETFVVSVAQNQRGEVALSDTSGAQSAGGGIIGQGYAAVLNMLGVRRLMPVETERLQGFPDGFTAIHYRGKPAADGPRYKAIGNAMAVPVLRWILSRIEAQSQSNHLRATQK